MEPATEPQPFTIGGVLSDAWGLYKRFFTRFVAVAALVYVVLGLVQALVAAATEGGGWLTAFVWGVTGGHGWNVFGLIVVTVIVLGIAGAIVAAIIAVLIGFLPTFLVQWITNIVVNSVTVPFVALAWTLTYFRLTGNRPRPL